MADEPAKTPIQSRYAQQYADDLAANRKEQGDITVQIAGLKERLARLKTEEDWLTQAQGSLPGALVPSSPEASPVASEAKASPADMVKLTEASAPAEAVADAPQTVPSQRQDEAVSEEQSKPAKKTAAAKKTIAKKAAKPPTKKPTTGKAAKKSTAKKPSVEEAPAQPAAATETPTDKAAGEKLSGPPLWQLALGILLKTPGQPCVAREVHDQLTRDHSDRATSIQTVRNSLEKLVAKSLAERSKQQGSVMYTAYADTDADAAPAADGETGQAPEAVAEKVPAGV
ncbi:hypothetical protein [Streptomyces roseolus]|uniref:hypothetical protein n=1 Tax=Streptomyces roseolus TaxID=67358 RepID=UPI0037BC9C45